MALYAITLSLSPAGRARSWEVDYRWDHWLGVGIWAVCALILHRQSTRRIPDRDPYLLPLATLLSGWGMLTIWRLYPEFGLRQSLWQAIAAGGLVAGLYLPSHLGFLRRYKYVWLSSGLLLTALTLLLGTNPLGQGPRMWLGCCGIYLQPSEPLKLLLIIYLSAYLAGLRFDPARRSTPLLPLLAPTLFMTGLAMALLLVQRDLGTATIFLFLYASIVYVASGQKRILLISLATLMLAGIAGYALFDVVRLRVDAWLNPWADPSGRSYQIVQSLLAVANGGLFGRGPGLGNPGLVPVPHSDFVFAAIAEETGLVGAFGLLALLALLAQRGLRIALRATDPYHRLLASGLTAHLVAQSVLIMGGNLRLLPLTGVTLPMVSYGGSSLLTSYLSLLFLLHVGSQEGEIPLAPRQDNRRNLQVAAFLLAGLGAVALAAGWWAFYRGPDLLTRTDNARRAIADRYVPRGAILDQRNDALAITGGQVGEYQRQVTYPPLSVVIGYNNPVYGQTGLEASQDSYLRGWQGYPGLTVWWNHLLYGQPPPGLDIRLSLDLRLQQTADAALGDRAGALVLLDAASGAVLVMASHPGFDANHLEGDWDLLIQDEAAPLLNRATLGLYPAENLAGRLFPGAQEQLHAVPQVGLAVAQAPTADQLIALSPLQAALVAAALTSDGIRPAAWLVTSVNTPTEGWIILAAEENNETILSPLEAQARVSALSLDDAPLWQYHTVEENGPGKSISWYLAGTQSTWSGLPLAIAVLLETDDSALAEQIGRSVLQQAMFP